MFMARDENESPSWPNAPLFADSIAEGAVAVAVPGVVVEMVVAGPAAGADIQSAVAVDVTHVNAYDRPILRRCERRDGSVGAVRVGEADGDGRGVRDGGHVQAAVVVEVAVRHRVRHD